jgi:hypothetical protein
MHVHKTGWPDPTLVWKRYGHLYPGSTRRSLRLTAISEHAQASGAGYTRDGNGVCAAACAKSLQIETGATGLEPATSGVTGLFHGNDDWRRWTRYRSIHVPLRASGV